jgi:hypothetical protein
VSQSEPITTRSLVLNGHTYGKNTAQSDARDEESAMDRVAKGLRHRRAARTIRKII